MDSMKDLMQVIEEFSLLILYGSETGNAQELAESIWYEARYQGIYSRIFAFDDFPIEKLPNENFVVFVVSTCGQGETPSNMSYNWKKLLIRHLSNKSLFNVKTSVIGLGNSSYKKYNFTAKRLNCRLSQLGAKTLHDLVLIDDENLLESQKIISQWHSNFWPLLKKNLLDLQTKIVQNDSVMIAENFDNNSINKTILDKNGKVILLNNYKFHQIFKLEIINDNDSKLEIFKGIYEETSLIKNMQLFSNQKNLYLSTICKIYNLHNYSSSRKCYHIEFSINPKKVQYEAGDHLGIFPTNNEILVEKIGQLLNVNLNTVFKLCDNDVYNQKRSLFPFPCSYRTALKHYVDICAPIKSYVLRALSTTTTNLEQKERLSLLGSNSEKGLKEYHEFIQKNKFNIMHILEIFDTCKPSINLLLELLPRLKPRFYSISSCSLINNSRIAITVLILQYVINGRKYFGVCSNYLASKKVNDKCLIFVKKSTFRLPNQIKTPIILIGSGTGIAPFRSFLFDRLFYKKQGKEIGEILLYFGCRHPNQDYYYEKELKNFVKFKLLTKLNVAFSRLNDKKCYVQHKVWNDREVIWELIQNKAASIYICGDGKKMAKDVQNTFLKIFMEIGELSEKNAQNFLDNLMLQKRFQLDIWS